MNRPRVFYDVYFYSAGSWIKWGEYLTRDEAESGRDLLRSPAMAGNCFRRRRCTALVTRESAKRVMSNPCQPLTNALKRILARRFRRKSTLKAGVR